MSLLGKIKNTGLLFLAFCLLFSCEKSGDFGFGSDEVSPVEFLVYEAPINSSVVILDSILTYDLNFGLIGSINDSDFGKVDATTYSRLNLRKQILRGISSDAVLDSVKLNIRVGYIYNSTNKEVNLKVYKLAERLKDTVYITSNSSPITNELIVEGTFTADNLDSIYSLDVNPTFANNLFELMRADDASIATQDSFESFFPGLAFKTSGLNNNIFGIRLDAISNITFYYRDLDNNGDVNLATTHVLTFGDLIHYYGLEIDRTGSQLDGLNEVSTEYTPASDLRYIQAGVGILTKLDISALENFSEQNPGSIINSAQFKIGPIQDLPAGVNPPNVLLLLLTDSENTIIRDGNSFRSIQQDGSSQIASTSPLRLIYDASTKTYRASITSYITNYYLDVFRRNELFVFPQTINNSLNQFIFDPRDISIEVFYSKLR